MNPEEKADAQQRGYQVCVVSAFHNDQWVEIYFNNTATGHRYGTEAEAWEGVKELITAGQYGY